MTAAGRTGGMGLRGRLVAFFVAISIVPVTVAVLVLQFQIDRQLERRSEHELATVRGGAITLIASERERAGDLADDLADRVGAALAEGALPPDLDTDEAAPWLREAVGAGVPGRADVAALLDGDRAVVALEVRDPAVEVDVDVPALLADAPEAGEPPDAALLEVRELRAVAEPDVVGWVVTGVWTDARLLERFAGEGGAAFIADGRVLAAAGPGADELPLGELPPPGTADTVSVAGDPVAVSVAPLTDDRDVLLALWTPLPPRASTLAVGALILVPVVLLAALLGWLLAMGVIAPIRRAADAARAVAAGDLSRTLEPTGGPELADLASALNTMRAELSQRLEELSQSRDQLRRSLDRLGLTLSSSLDLNRTLAVVVETARDTLQADRALLFLFTPERDALYCKVARGLAPPPALDAAAGVVGHVARHGAPLLLPSPEGGETPRHVGGEPVGVSQLAVPLLGRGRVLGVMTLLRDDPELPFTRTDLDTIRSFAAQASVAIENVLLHEEARRLSVTDSLTGLWNFRYFQLQAEREIDGATRFERPLALMIVDIDHFKAVNDEHGHQVGDVVLAEVARRLRGATRAPDVVARYGGEEFVVLLPGTDLHGALATAERVRCAVGGEPVNVRGTRVPLSGDEVRAGPEELTVTCSAGVAVFPVHGRSVAALLRSADAAMYAAKQQGRNRVVGAEPSTEASTRGPKVSN